jgi:hypothetical protein
MICYLHYISASRRLKEAKKTVMMLGDDEAPPMLRAQCEMIKLEKEYYADECQAWSLGLASVAIVGILSWITYNFWSNY